MNSFDWDKLLRDYKSGVLDIDKGAKKLEEVLSSGGTTTEAFLESLKVMYKEDE